MRQKFLKTVYPVFSWSQRIFGNQSKSLSNKDHVVPPVSFYDLTITLADGTSLKFDDLKGKKILLVNTASNCGYTPQYKALEQLYRSESDKLIIIGFPANDFNEQEKGNDTEIAQFCKANFDVTFPIATKASVIRGNNQQPVFQWLTDKMKNGWNSKAPGWNFSKYLINEQGVLTDYFDPAISPLSIQIKNAVEER